MRKFTEEQIRRRTFERAAWVLQHFWEEQQDDPKREASVHTRIFDTLVPRQHIVIGKSENGGGHIEHLVPCALLRNRAFEMYWNNHSVNDVADMLEKFLRVAYITRAEAYELDHGRGWKTCMPNGWDWESGSVTARLDMAGIRVVPLETA